MTKFKVGDKVRATGGLGPVNRGYTGTVLDVSRCPLVAWNVSCPKMHNGGGRSNKENVWAVTQDILESVSLDLENK